MKKRDIDSGRIDSMGRRIKMSGKSHAHQEDKKTFHYDFPLTRFYTGNDTKLKNMDCDELSVELVEISNDPYIDWGSSSQGDFTFSIEKAYQWHHGQERANRGNHPKTPYIEHPLRNTLRLHRWGVFDGEVLTAAVLHDVVEDCADKITGIKDQNHDEFDLRDKAVTECKNIFGDNVTRIIKDVSNPIASIPAWKKRTKHTENTLTMFLMIHRYSWSNCQIIMIMLVVSITIFFPVKKIGYVGCMINMLR